MRRAIRVFQRISCDLVRSPNRVDADVVIVHALFHGCGSGAGSGSGQSAACCAASIVACYGLLTALEARVYANRKVIAGGLAARTANLLQRYFHRKDEAVVPNGVDTGRENAGCAPGGEKGRAETPGNRYYEDFVLLLIGNDWRVKELAVWRRFRTCRCNSSWRATMKAVIFMMRRKRVGVLERCPGRTSI